MRRFAAAALSAAALSATLFAVTGTANAAGASTPAPGVEFGTAQLGGTAQPGRFTAQASRQAPKPSSKKHYFQIGGAPGAYTSGDWYWTRANGPFKIVLELNVHDTKRDGKVAGLAVRWNYKGSQWVMWFADTKGAGTSQYAWTSFVPEVTNLSGFDMVGFIRATPMPGNPNHRTFEYTARGPWVTIRH